MVLGARREALNFPTAYVQWLFRCCTVLFYFENVAARDKPDNEKALELLCHLDGAAANYFFETFAPDGTLSEDGKDF